MMVRRALAGLFALLSAFALYVGCVLAVIAAGAPLNHNPRNHAQEWLIAVLIVGVAAALGASSRILWRRARF